MNIEYEKNIEGLNHVDVNVRLENLRKLMEGITIGQIEKPVAGNDMNNHIHTSYSFSPYSPTKAVWMAFNAGLTTAGIMDHDSIGGAQEFIEAGEIVGIATTIGVECRVDFSKTILNGKRINNPDQDTVAYMALHGIPHTQVDTVRDFFAPYTKERNNRNRLMVDKLNEIFNPYGIELNFDRDVVPVSMRDQGGSITERHILYALAGRIMEKFGKGESLLDFIRNTIKLNVSTKIDTYLKDTSNPFYQYDLLGLLKSELVERFYIQATSECPDVKDVIGLANRIGAVAAYAYLGDVGESVTGDKKSQKFEDSFLDTLFQVLKELGFQAVTYMPSRNTLTQLLRVKALCDQYGFFQISGEDINSPRQSFICTALRNEEFKNLMDSTWALIGHEKTATEDVSKGMFSRETISRIPDLRQRIKVYGEIGRK